MAENPPLVRIQVLTVAGEELDLELEPDRLVSHLKVSIAEQWAFPPSCQRLVLDAQVLGDTNSLRTLQTDGGDDPVIVTMLVVMDAVIQDLEEGGCVGKARSALDALAGLASRGNSVATTSIMECLDHLNGFLRHAAMDALLKVAGATTCDETILSNLRTRASQGEDGIRTVAVRGLGGLAPKGDEETISLLCNALSDQSAEVRREVAEALSSVAERGDKRVSAALALSVKDQDALSYTCVRRAVADAIGKVAPIGDPAAVAALTACFEDRNLYVRDSAVRSVLALSTRNNDAVVDTACACLWHRRPEVRQLGTEVLTKVVDVGNADVLANLASLLSRATSEPVRHDLLRVLSALAAPMDPQALSAVEPCLEAGDARVRHTAMEAVLVICGDEVRASDWLTSSLEAKGAKAKRAAYEALRTLEDIGDRCAVKVMKILDQKWSKELKQQPAETGLKDGEEPWLSCKQQ